MVCQRVEDRLFSQFLLERMQGSKGNKYIYNSKKGERRSKGESELRMNIHPVSSTFPSVLGNPQSNSLFGAHHNPASCSLSSSDRRHQMAAGWRLQTAMMMSGWLNVGLWQLK